MPQAPQGLPLLALALVVGCVAPEPPPFVEDPVEQIPATEAPLRPHPVYFPCALPDALADVVVPDVDLDDVEAVFGDGGMPLVEIHFPDGAWDQACENALEVALWMDARRRGEEVSPIDRPLVRVDVVIQDRALYDVGFRFRGQSNLYAMFFDQWNRPIEGGLDICKADRMRKKASYRLDLDAFVPGRRIAGQRALDLAGREGSDAAYLREATAQHVARQFGLDAPLVGHARVCRDGEYDGLFTLAEESDFRAIVERLYGSQGDSGYWEVIAPSSQAWDANWTATEGWQRVYDAVPPTSEDDIGRLGRLLDAGSAVKAGEDPGDLQDLIDVDAWLRNIALDMVIPDYDGMMGNHKNHALYDHPTRGILPIAYDKDLAFVDLGNYRFGLCSGSIWGGNPCWSSRRSPPILAGYLLERYPEPYLARIRELIDGPLAPETLLPWVEERADALRPWVAADRYYQPDGPACDFDPEFCQWYTPGAWEYEILSIGFNVEARIEEVERQLNGEFLCSKSCRDPPHPWVDEGL